MKWLHCRMLSFFGPVLVGWLAVVPGRPHDAATAPRPTDAAPASRSRRVIVCFQMSLMNYLPLGAFSLVPALQRPSDAIMTQPGRSGKGRITAAVGSGGNTGAVSVPTVALRVVYP